MIINLTQHPATQEQIAAGVVDLPHADRATLLELLTVDTLPTRAGIVSRCSGIAGLAQSVFAGKAGSAMIGGAGWMMAELERSLDAVSIVAVYAFSVRDSIEQAQLDGSIKKATVFRHAGFVRAK